jgi:opacity protein-like surface antigen
MIRKSLAALLLVTLVPIAAQAQSLFKATHRAWEVSIFAGGSFPGDGLFATPVTGSTQQTSRTVGLSYGSGSQLGLRVTENRWEHWGAAMEYGFSNQPLRFTNLSDAVPMMALGHSIHRFHYDVLYYPFDRSRRLRPFAFAGSGVSLFYVKGSSKDTAAAMGIHLSDPWKFTFSWGGGVKYLIRDQVATSFQFSDNISGVPHYGLPPNGRFVSGQYIPGFRPDGLLRDWLISLSFIYQWGGR